MKIEHLRRPHQAAAPRDNLPMHPLAPKAASSWPSRYHRQLMRTGILGLFVTAVALVSFPAQAQFANKSLGIGLGYMRINSDAQIEWALPLTLEGTLYVENHIDVFARVPLMLAFERSTGYQIVCAGLDIGARYLFLEESFRPYFGLQGGFMYINRANGQSNVLFGPGATLGAEYFVTDSISIGPRGFFNLFIAINERLRWAYGASFAANAYF